MVANRRSLIFCVAAFAFACDDGDSGDDSNDQLGACLMLEADNACFEHPKAAENCSGSSEPVKSCPETNLTGICTSTEADGSMSRYFYYNEEDGSEWSGSAEEDCETSGGEWEAG